MRKLNHFLFVFAIIAICITGCSEEDVTPVFTVSDGGIITENYTGSTNLEFSYSTDDGITWGSEVLDLAEGSSLFVKIVAGTVDLTTYNYTFDWSASSPLPEDVNDEIASFIVGRDSVSLKVTVFELINISTTNIAGDYSGDGTLTYSFSTDDGINWFAEAPTKLNKGTDIMIKVTDDSADLTSRNFEFDWSGSTLSPSNTSAAIAEFTSVEESFSAAASVIEIDELVVIARADGKLYSVNKTTGDLTEIGAIVDGNKSPISGLRALKYDKITGKCFLGSTAQNNGIFYSLNITTGLATSLNDNADYSRDGISALLMASDGNVLATYYSNSGSGTSLGVFNSTTGVEETPIGLEVWTPGGLIYGASNDEIFMGGYGGIYFANVTGVVSNGVGLVPSENIVADMYVMDLAKDKKNDDIYSLILDVGDTGFFHLVKVDISTGEVTEIMQIADDVRSNWYHCLAFIPKHRLPSL